VPDRIATELLLIARSPVTGRVRHRSALEKGLRAGLLADLALLERISRGLQGPEVVDSTSTRDRILNAVLATVGDRPDIAWRRWYHHVAVDRVAITKELVESGRWTKARDPLGRVKYVDTDPDATLLLVQNAVLVAELKQAPADAREAILAILTTMSGSITGRPRPRELRRTLRPLLDVIGYAADPIRLTVEAALAGCAASVRKRSRILA
jgi:hypothetical protein